MKKDTYLVPLIMESLRTFGVINLAMVGDSCGSTSNYIWGLGKIYIDRKEKYSIRTRVKTCVIFLSLAIL